ncbi:AtuA-related protein [Microbacterium saperdae]
MNLRGSSPASVRLGEVAHARAGDKGDSSILMIATYDPDRFGDLIEALGPATIAVHFGTAPENVTVTAAPLLGALSIVVRHVLEGGVTRSLRVDPHGKSLSGHLLDLPIAWHP